MHRSKKKTVNNIGLRDKGNGLDEEEEDIFEVEKFLDADWKDGKMYYLVQWKGYGSDERTWEPDEHLLTCEQLKEDFWNEHRTFIEMNMKREEDTISDEESSIKSRIANRPMKNEPGTSITSGASRFSDQEKGTSPSKKGSNASTKTSNKGLTSKKSLTSNISNPEDDDDSDTDERIKDLLAKWGDKRYKKKQKDDPSPKKPELRSKLSAKSSNLSNMERKPETDFIGDFAFIGSSKDSAPQTEESELETGYVSTPQSVILNPDKTLLSSESIRQIIQQDIIEKEKTKKVLSGNFRKSEVQLGQSTVDTYDASNEKKESPLGKRNKMANSLSQDQHLEKIREMRSEKQIGILAKLENERGSVVFNNEKGTESHFSKSTPLVPFSVDQLAMTSQENSKCQVPIEGGPLSARKELIPSEKKRAVIDKSNLDRLKGIIKVVMKEQSKEHELASVEKSVIEDKSNKLDDNILSREKESVDNGSDNRKSVDSVEKIDCQKTSKRNLKVEGMAKEETSVKKTDGAAMELNVRCESRPHVTQVEIETKKVAGDKATKDDLERILTSPAETQGVDSVDSIVQSKNKANEDGFTTGTTIQNPGRNTRKIEQLDARQTKRDLNISNKGFGSEQLITDDEKCLDAGKQKTVDCELEKGRGGLTVGHESNKQEKAVATKEREKSLRDESKVENNGTVEMQRRPKASLASRAFIDSTIDSKGKKPIDPRKKGKTQRYGLRRSTRKETFSSGKDDVIGGILGNSAILVSIDERGSKKDEYREDSRNERVTEMEERQPSVFGDSLFDLDDFYIDDNGLFLSNGDNDGEGKSYLNSIDVTKILPINLSQEDMAKSIQAGDWSTTLGAIAGGMSPDYWDSKTGGTLLWKAIEENNQDVAKKLIKFGADIEIKAENGKTALMLAVELGRYGLVNMLLRVGAHINAQQYNEETALILACRKGDEDIINLLLCNGADTKLTPKSNPKDVYEYAPEYQAAVIKKVVDAYNMKLSNNADEILKSCLSGTETSIEKPHLCRCISPGDKKFNEFYFTCPRNASEKGVTILLLCAPIKFESSGDIKLFLEGNIDNGIEVVLLNKEHQIPVIKGSHILYFLFPKVGQLNTLTLRTHKCGYKLLVAVYSMEQNESWVDNSLALFYREYGDAHDLKFTNYQTQGY